jgi:hypothetical protein
MTWKWSTLIVLVALVGCSTGSSGEGLLSTSTTEVTTTSSSTSPTSTFPPLPTEMVLNSDGLGIVSFGDPVDDVMTTLTDLLGPSSNDTLYEPPFDVPYDWHGGDRGPAACFIGTGTGYSCFDYLRLVAWEDVGLWLVFSDLEVNPDAGGDDYFVQVSPGFAGYDYVGGSSLLYTADGITIGSTSTELLALGDRVEFAWTECGEIVDFSIADPEEAGDGYVWGALDEFDSEALDTTGSPRADAMVRYIHAGVESSC